jgi:hypothetical protein
MQLKCIGKVNTSPNAADKLGVHQSSGVSIGRRCNWIKTVVMMLWTWLNACAGKCDNYLGIEL